MTIGTPSQMPSTRASEADRGLELLTLEELESNTRRLLAEFGDRVTVTQVGNSWTGRPIEMLSIGEGARQVLVVGVPHANEPAGAVTVERLISVLLGATGERELRGMRWNFIKAIDPEGLRLNGDWLKKPRTVRNYVENFYRPPLLRQPETTFPFRVGDHEFRNSTPENRAYQRAFELTRPVVHACLHHSDIGGAFHCISREVEHLNSRLEQVILDHGIAQMSGFESPGISLRWVSPCVGVFPSVELIESQAREAGMDFAAVWPFGELSPGYGEKQCGAFTLITEVPLWDDDRLRDNSPSGLTQRDRLVNQSKEYEELGTFLERAIPELQACAVGPDEEQMFASLSESANDVKMVRGLFDQLQHAPDIDAELSVAGHLMKSTTYDLAAARFLGTARRLAALGLRHGSSGDLRRVVEEADARIDHITKNVLQSDRFKRTPLSAMTGVQMDSIFAAVDIVRSEA